jgi:hypothetical protein
VKLGSLEKDELLVITLPPSLTLLFQTSNDSSQTKVPENESKFFESFLSLGFIYCYST